MNTTLKNVLFGKQQIPNIVSIEPKDNTVEVFIEENGTIRSEFFPNEYWILSNKPLEYDYSWIKLQGVQHYRYIKTYQTREDFIAARRRFRDKDIYSIYNPKEALMVYKGMSNFINMKVDEVSLLSFDIETTTLDPKDKNALVVMIATTYRNRGKLTHKLFSYDEYDGQGDMLEAFVEHVQKLNPTILLGHNITSFDIPYLNTIASKYNVSMALGRDKSNIVIENYEKKFRVDGNRDLSYNPLSIYGREIVDTYFLAIKADIGRKYNSYGLKKIIEQEGWEIEGRVFYDASKIRDNYKNKEEMKKIKEYAKFDALDAITLYDKFGPTYFYMAQNIPKSFQNIIESASGGQINSLLLRSYMQDGFSIPKSSPVPDFQGAISFAVPGVYRNMLKIDFAGLYPSIIRQYQLYDKQKDPNKNLLMLVEYFSLERLKNKKIAKESGDRFYEDMQQMQKVMCNSFYGFLSTNGLNFNSPSIGSFITAKGRELLGVAIKWATDKDVDYWLNMFEDKTK